MSDSGEKLLWTVSEVAAKARVSERTVYKEIAAGRLRTRKVGRRTLIMAADFQAWIDSWPTGEFAKHLARKTEKPKRSRESTTASSKSTPMAEQPRPPERDSFDERDANAMTDDETAADERSQFDFAAVLGLKKKASR
jgi:excisionase family DNA binding protein